MRNYASNLVLLFICTTATLFLMFFTLSLYASAQAAAASDQQTLRQFPPASKAASTELLLTHGQTITDPEVIEEMRPLSETGTAVSESRPMLGGLSFTAAISDDFPLVVGTGAFGPTPANDTYQIDVTTNISSSLFSGFPVWGATFDPAETRILFTSSLSGGTTAVDGAYLYELPITGTTPVYLGVISTTTDSLRIDGLAISKETLYGVHQFNDVSGPAGIYEIDKTTLSASLVLTLPAASNNISGIDADPLTGKIYGVDDTGGALVEIDLTVPTVTTVVNYPPDETDIDGLAIGEGKAYLVPDDPTPGLIFVYDFESMTYTTSLSSPFTATDTFAGAAFVTEYRLYLPLIFKDIN